jgi:hypothetical protein
MIEHQTRLVKVIQCKYTKEQSLPLYCNLILIVVRTSQYVLCTSQYVLFFESVERVVFHAVIWRIGRLPKTASSSLD